MITVGALAALISKWGLSLGVAVVGLIATVDPSVTSGTPIETLATAFALLIGTVILQIVRKINGAVPDSGQIPDISEEVNQLRKDLLILTDKVDSLVRSENK